jgi:hypothetical protein
VYFLLDLLGDGVRRGMGVGSAGYLSNAIMERSDGKCKEDSGLGTNAVANFGRR